MQTPDYFIFAGEPSGDLHGHELLQGLFEKEPNLKVTAVGGPMMRKYPIECVLPMEAFQVMGFIDIIPAMPKLIRQFHLVKNTILQSKPKIVVLIDYPGFNLRLARSLRKNGYQGKICHYICPSVWAWGKKRIPLMAKNLDLLLSILPFEKKYFQSTSLPVQYIGNPLLEKTAHHKFQPIDQLAGKKVLALFPGSRKKELQRNLSVQLKTAAKLQAQDPELTVALSVSSQEFLPFIENLCRQANLHPHLIEQQRSYDLMKHSYAAIATSGTVTLELALFNIPTVMTYGLSSFDQFLAKHILRILLPYYCLVNIIVEREVFPELLGHFLNVESLFEKASTFLLDGKQRNHCLDECQLVRETLTNKQASKLAVAALSSL